jgi:hypothetical protein
MTRSKKRSGIEWLGGLFSMPAYVTDDGERYHPEMLIWMDAGGALLGHTMGKPGALIELAVESLRSTMERPLIGRPHAPRRVRVASHELADALRAGHAGCDVVCAPTPELDAVLAAMREQLVKREEAELSYLSAEVGPEPIAALFQAAAELFRSRPWKIVPGDQSLISVTIEALGVKNAALSVIGQMGESLGFIVFPSLDDFEAYLDAADAMERGEERELPRHVALNFERGAELDAALREEIAEQHWEVAGGDAYPWLMAIEGLGARPPTGEDVTLAEAISRALSEVLKEPQALLAAWRGGEPVSRTLAVATHAGDLEVSIRVPFEQNAGDDRPPYDVLANLVALAEDAQDGDEDGIDPEARRPLEDELVDQFAHSPEAKALTDIQACRFVMDLAAAHFTATIATLGPRELREIVFELIPRKVSIDASTASWVIDELRAFYAFLGRAYRLAQAGACLRVLGGDAVKELEVALADKRKFGMAKSIFMGGREAGFDMDSREGIEAWMRVVQSRPLPASVGLPPRPPSRTTAKAAARPKKDQRKAARKARKRNR